MRRALADLPQQYARGIENLEIVLARVPSGRDRRRRSLGNATLYGLYEGVPLTYRDSGYDRAMPDRITIFWGPLVRDFPDEARLAEEVRKTVYHEIAHYFGLDEDDVSDTSVE